MRHLHLCWCFRIWRECCKWCFGCWLFVCWSILPVMKLFVPASLDTPFSSGEILWQINGSFLSPLTSIRVRGPFWLDCAFCFCCFFFLLLGIRLNLDSHRRSLQSCHRGQFFWNWSSRSLLLRSCCVCGAWRQDRKTNLKIIIESLSYTIGIKLFVIRKDNKWIFPYF